MLEVDINQRRANGVAFRPKLFFICPYFVAYRILDDAERLPSLLHLPARLRLEALHLKEPCQAVGDRLLVIQHQNARERE